MTRSNESYHLVHVCLCSRNNESKLAPAFDETHVTENYESKERRRKRKRKRKREKRDRRIRNT